MLKVLFSHYQKWRVVAIIRYDRYEVYVSKSKWKYEKESDEL